MIAADYRETTAIAVPESIYSPMRPAEKVAYAAEVASALKDVIVKKGLAKKIQGRDHIKVEGWQTAAALCGISCRVTHTTVSEDGQGYIAHAEAVRTDSGIVVGAGDGMCSRNERIWAKRDDYALRAMAQTRAVSRALRGVLAFVITLAGYEATPVEEMPPEGVESTPPPPPELKAPPDPYSNAALIELHERAGKPNGTLGAYIVAEVAPNFASRSPKTLTPDEKKYCWTLLDALHAAEAIASSPVADRKISPETNGRLFRLLDECGLKDKADRIAFAADHGVKVESFSNLTEQQGRKLIEVLRALPLVLDEKRSPLL